MFLVPGIVHVIHVIIVIICFFPLTSQPSCLLLELPETFVTVTQGQQPEELSIPITRGTEDSTCQWYIANNVVASKLFIAFE